MPNKKGGKGYKKAKKGSFQTPTFEIAQEGQTYARIVKKLGDKRFSIIIHGTQEKTIGRARGALKGWQTMKTDDVILVSGRDFRNNPDESFVQDTYDILLCYMPDQVRKLKKLGQITDPSFDDCLQDNNIQTYEYNDEEDDEQFIPQRQYDMPSSDSESDDEDEEDIDFNKL